MTEAAGDWGGGYVTDIAYLPGYYRHQSPLHLNLACLTICHGLSIARSNTETEHNSQQGHPNRSNLYLRNHRSLSPKMFNRRTRSYS